MSRDARAGVRARRLFRRRGGTARQDDSDNDRAQRSPHGATIARPVKARRRAGQRRRRLAQRDDRRCQRGCRRAQARPAPIIIASRARAGRERRLPAGPVPLCAGGRRLDRSSRLRRTTLTRAAAKRCAQEALGSIDPGCERRRGRARSCVRPSRWSELEPGSVRPPPAAADAIGPTHLAGGQPSQRVALEVKAAVCVDGRDGPGLSPRAAAHHRITVSLRDGGGSLLLGGDRLLL